MAKDLLVGLIAEGKHLGGKYIYYKTLTSALQSGDTRFVEVTHSGIPRYSMKRIASRLYHTIGGGHQSRMVRLELDRRVGELNRLASSIRPSVFHAQHPIGTVTLARSRFRGTPIVQTIHSFWLEECNAQGMAPGSELFERYREIQEEAFEKTSLFITLNNLQTRKLKRYGLPAERILQIPNAVDTQYLLSASQPFRHPTKYLAIASRLSPEKGIEVAIDALDRLPGEHGPDLLIVGDGPARDSLMEHARSKRVAERVKFLGPREHGETIGIMQGAELVLCPSVPYCGVEDSAPLSILEAMAVGTPVAASIVGGIPEYVDHGQTGYLFEAGDSQALADIIGRHLAFNAWQKERISLQCVQKMSSHNFDSWIGSVLQAYRSLSPAQAAYA